MMSAAAVIGLGAGKRLLLASSSSSDSNNNSKLSALNDYGLPIPISKKNYNNIVAAKNTKSLSNNNRHNQPAVRTALKEQYIDTATVSDPSAAADVWVHRFMHAHNEEDENNNNEMREEASSSLFPEYSVDAMLLLQKSMLEKQWNLSPSETLVLKTTDIVKEDIDTQIQHTGPKRSARRRRIDNKRRLLMNQNSSTMQLNENNKHLTYNIKPELLQNRMKGYVKGLTSEALLTHSEVVELSKLVKTGLYLVDTRSRLKERIGCEPSEEQLATSLRISRAELQLKLIECSLAREKLAMSNVRLVMSIAQKYDNMGAEMADLVQGGLIGLLRGIEKFDSSKGFKISTYVYWWIRQGVSRALVESSRTLRLPTHVHERLSLIRNAKMKLEEKGITPSIDRIAESLNMSKKKINNATEANSKVFSLDREAFPSLNGLPGETLHSYIADNRLENNPWHGVDEWALKDEVNRLLSTTLIQREREIIRLYFGLDNECLTWEDISKRIGLSRERVRQVGLVALEKLKHAARKRRVHGKVKAYFCKDLNDYETPDKESLFIQSESTLYTPFLTEMKTCRSCSIVYVIFGTSIMI